MSALIRSHRRAVSHLREADPVLAHVMDRVGQCRFEHRELGTHFDALLRAIMFQQLSGKAANTILSRFQGLYGGRMPLPAELLATSDERLRSAGVSRQKIGYMRDLAAKVVSDEVPLGAVDDLSDEEIIQSLIRVKGIGRWSAQMFLMFRLGRPNVLPEIDLGIQKAIRLAYGMRRMPKSEKVRAIGAKWDPYSTVACWYLWRSLDGGTGTAKPRSTGRMKRTGAPAQAKSKVVAEKARRISRSGKDQRSR